MAARYFPLQYLHFSHCFLNCPIRCMSHKNFPFCSFVSNLIVLLLSFERYISISQNAFQPIPCLYHYSLCLKYHTSSISFHQVLIQFHNSVRLPLINLYLWLTYFNQLEDPESCFDTFDLKKSFLTSCYLSNEKHTWQMKSHHSTTCTNLNLRSHPAQIQKVSRVHSPCLSLQFSIPLVTHFYYLYLQVALALKHYCCLILGFVGQFLVANF